MTDLATSYSIMGTVSGFLGDVQQVKDNLIHGRALNIPLKNLGPENVGVAGSYRGLGIVCLALGELQKAKEYHGRALNILLKNLGPENVDVACSYRGLGDVFLACGELQQAKDPSMDPVVTEPNVCAEVLSFLKTSLERLHEECHWLQTVSWDLCAKCSLCPRQFVRGTGKCYWHAEVECSHDDCAHYVSLTKKPFVCSRTLRGPKFCPPETWSQVLDDLNGKNHNGKSLQSFPQTEGISLAQCSSVHFGKQDLPHQTGQSVVPSQVSRTDFERPEIYQGGETFIPEEVSLAGKILKEGILSRDDHMGLSHSISEDWRRLGLLLGIRVEDLDNIDQRRRDYFDKAHQMLRLWKEKNASNATYRFLCQALCHECLNRRDLAERFCFR